MTAAIVTHTKTLKYKRLTGNQKIFPPLYLTGVRAKRYKSRFYALRWRKFLRIYECKRWVIHSRLAEFTFVNCTALAGAPQHSALCVRWLRGVLAMRSDIALAARSAGHAERHSVASSQQMCLWSVAEQALLLRCGGAWRVGGQQRSGASAMSVVGQQRSGASARSALCWGAPAPQLSVLNSYMCECWVVYKLIALICMPLQYAIKPL